MFGLIDNNIAVISVILDRRKFWSHTVLKEEPDWQERLFDFLKKPNVDKRVRLIMLEGVSFLDRLKFEDKNLTQKAANTKQALDALVSTCFLLVFDTPSNIDTFENIQVMDAEFNGASWDIKKLIPQQFNAALAAGEAGFGIVKAKPKVEVAAAPPPPFSPEVPSPQIQEVPQEDVPVAPVKKRKKKDVTQNGKSHTNKKPPEVASPDREGKANVV